MKAKIEIEIKKQKFKLETSEARELFESLKEIFDPGPPLTVTPNWAYPTYPQVPGTYIGTVLTANSETN